VIYLEGGLGPSPSGAWRFPRQLLESYVRAGAVAIVADADLMVLTAEKAVYREAADFLGAHIDYGPEDSSEPVHGADLTHYWRSNRTIVIAPESMGVSAWLKPIYEGVSEIAVALPVRLSHWTELLATCNRDTSGALQRDVWVERVDPVPFASVREMGDGYVVLIAGNVSSDHLLECCPDNTQWLVNVVQFLAAEVEKETSRKAPLRRLQDVVDAARARARLFEDETEVGDAFAAGVEAALRDEGRRLPAERLQQVRDALEKQFGSHWAALNESARTNLMTGDVLRRDLEEYASNEPAIDFSMAVSAYSKALESALSALIFRPYHAYPEARALPDAIEDSRQHRSVVALQRFLDGTELTLGQMAFCLLNIACALRNAEPNAFARYLSERLLSLDRFCDEQAWPKRLMRYNEKFRNRAAHIDRLTLEECMEARAYLLDEPTKLLISLLETISPKT
jgi:hypothetical protein